MSGRTPIDPADIKAGDLIRWERDFPGAGYNALEVVASRDGQNISPYGQHYLLDRPKPPVGLPTEPTLGWAEYRGHRYLEVWERNEAPGMSDRVVTACTGFGPITAFTPATAVPTAALNELRRRVTCYGEGSPTSEFLAAVDEANGADA